MLRLVDLGGRHGFVGARRVSGFGFGGMHNKTTEVSAGSHTVADYARLPAQVWLCVMDCMTKLLQPDAEWSFVKQHLDGIKLYVDEINDAANDPINSSNCPDWSRTHGYQVAVELGCCLVSGSMV